MRVIQVVAAAIVDQGKVFCAQRHRGGEAGAKWEFPGGKVEPGESEEQALRRELGEELKLDVVPVKPIVTMRHTYPTITIDLHLWLVRLATPGQVPTLTEHLAYAWKRPEELGQVDWADADREVYPAVQKMVARTFNQSATCSSS